jgi:prolyl oligopeptidase
VTKKFLYLTAFTFLSSVFATAAPITYPKTPQRVVTDQYHGEKVTDSYRWLENGTDAEVEKWTKTQDDLARSYFNGLSVRPAIHSQIDKWKRFESPRYGFYEYRGGKFFGVKRQPPMKQRLLVTVDSLDNLKTEKVILDLNKLSPSGSTSFDFYKPSLDGSLLAVSLSDNGSEEGKLKIYDVKTGKSLNDEIPRVHKPTAGGGVAWAKGNKGFYYTRYPAPGERKKEEENFYHQVYFHKIGEPIAKDVYAIGKDFPRIAEIHLDSSEDGKYIMAMVSNGDGGEHAHYLLKPDGTWVTLTRFSDKIKQFAFGRHDDLYLVSRNQASKGKILRLELANPDLSNAKLVVKEGEGVINDIASTDKKLFVEDLLGGPSRLRVFDLDGSNAQVLATPPVSTIWGLLPTTGDQLFFNSEGYSEPGTLYECILGKRNKIRKTAVTYKSPVSFKDIEVRREFATSKDGTKVPVSILFRKGTKLNGQAPTLLSGYGGYGISMTPYFNPDLAIWLKNGGIYAMANIRGGGEYGEKWHLEGNLTKKQNVFDDFIASAEYLIKKKYTNPKKLAIYGRSNGGLLMGAVLTQRPELFRAVVAGVGIFDMLRVELDPNGAFNITEFGTVKDPVQYKALGAYSPYHHVKDGAPYPAVLLFTGVNDGRVNPFQSKKMTARLQKASSSENPILLRVEYKGGHGMGRNLEQEIEESTDIYAFLFDQLKMQPAYREIGKP